ncbi:hypothetical protein BaRGS_00007984, partial [Batillaria attramentaria]
MQNLPLSQPIYLSPLVHSLAAQRRRASAIISIPPPVRMRRPRVRKRTTQP